MTGFLDDVQNAYDLVTGNTSRLEESFTKQTGINVESGGSIFDSIKDKAIGEASDTVKSIGLDIGGGIAEALGFGGDTDDADALYNWLSELFLRSIVVLLGLVVVGFGLAGMIKQVK